jgi:hypothetical protein
MLRCKHKLTVGRRRDGRVLGRATAFSVVLGLLALVGSLSARANAVVDWDAIAASTITPPPTVVLPPPAVTEAERRPIFQVDLASVHVAIYDAVNAIDRKHEPFEIVPKSKAKGASQEAAVVGAAYGVLKGLFPGRSALYQSAYDSYVAGAGADPSKVRGLAVGAEVAAGVLELRKNDGRLTPVMYVTTGAPGDFVPGPTPLVNPFPPFVKPFAIRRASQFLLHPVHEFTSTDQMVMEVADARVFGGMHYRNSTREGARLGRRTAEWIGERFFQRVDGESGH